MTCPNCGAELERHAFTHVCSYCGYVAAAKDAPQAVKDAPQKELKGISEKPCFYEYIAKNLRNIQQSPFVDIVQKQDSFECVSSKSFYPKDGHYSLDKTLSFQWYAKITKLGIRFSLLVTSSHVDAQNHLCIKMGGKLYTFKQQGELFNKLAFPMTLVDFLLFCVHDDYEFDTNLYDKAYLNDYYEFVTYTHRFFHIVIDMSKYRYSLNEKLLTD